MAPDAVSSFRTGHVVTALMLRCALTTFLARASRILDYGPEAPEKATLLTASAGHRAGGPVRPGAVHAVERNAFVALWLAGLRRYFRAFAWRAGRHCEAGDDAVPLSNAIARTGRPLTPEAPGAVRGLLRLAWSVGACPQGFLDVVAIGHLTGKSSDDSSWRYEHRPPDEDRGSAALLLTATASHNLARSLAFRPVTPFCPVTHLLTHHAHPSAALSNFDACARITRHSSALRLHNDATVSAMLSATACHGACGPHAPLRICTIYWGFTDARVQVARFHLLQLAFTWRARAGGVHQDCTLPLGHPARAGP
mmetsp:Transcript_30059/g.55499  ORF Transcript_30059/g.55499 Transcript_30059/m.55499 type:complete len:310 (+) Transcript_30059:2865-3794(+)